MATTKLETIYGTGQAKSGYSVSYRPYVNWYVSAQDIAKNTSTITIYGGLQRISGTTAARGTFSGAVSTDNKNFNVSLDATSGNSIKTATFTKVVTHNADGTKSVGISMWGSIVGSNSYTGTTLNAVRTLPTIPRASVPTLSKTTMTVGDSITVYTNRKSSSFTHQIDLWKYGETTTFQEQKYGTIATGVGTSWVWDSSDLEWWMAQHYPNTTSGKFFIRCYTYSGSTNLGYRDVIFTANIPDTRYYRPVLKNISVSDNTDAVQLVGTYLQNYSVLRIDATVSAGAYGATIKEYLVKVGSGSQFSYASPVIYHPLTLSGSLSVSVTAKDSRGFLSPVQTVTITALPYNKPTVSTGVSVERVNAASVPNTLGTYALVTRFSGTSSSIKVGGVEKNQLYHQIRYRRTGTTNWLGTYTPAAKPGPWNNVSLRIGANDISIAEAFEVEVSAWDTLTFDKPARRRLEIPVSATALAIGKTGIGVGKVFENDGPNLQVGGDAFIEGALTVDRDTYVNGSLHLADPNKIIIDGVAYQRSGSWTTPSLTMTQTSGTYVFTSPNISVSHLPAVPDGWTYSFTILSTSINGITWLSRMNSVLRLVTATYHSRSATISWQLVKR